MEPFAIAVTLIVATICGLVVLTVLWGIFSGDWLAFEKIRDLIAVVISSLRGNRAR